MKLSHKITISALFAMAIMLPGITTAQSYRLPGQHTQQHGDLIASQNHSSMEVDNTTKYLEALFAEEEEPEFDIYTEGWESGFVNCYKNADVPQTAVIDVSKYHIPHPGYITSPYGYRRRFRRMHKGIDIKANTGDTVRAAFDGKVRLTKYERRGYGYYVVLRHTNDLETVYGHLSKFLVEPDQYVRAGDPIALAGNTGRSFGSHLHFETRYMGYAINPAAIFDFANQTTHTDLYTFDKNTYQNARNFSPEANAAYAAQYRATHKIEYGNKKSTASSNSKSSGASTVTVRKGASLSRIASRNGTSVAAICRLNGIKSSTKIKPGQKLRVR
ncbi:MAG: peptidoglycan DD-metalloendopeptidase family protein [Muribaculaceae bacterium]|nr:peptidoglycan DD-metalloendopeptidase family protein [Muribaculaceae bacterium]